MIVFLVIRYFVYAVAASSLTMVWQVSFIFVPLGAVLGLLHCHRPCHYHIYGRQVGIKFKFRYASTRDIGISVYLLLVVVFFYNLIPLEIIKPVFFADPLGALVGRQLTESGVWNPAWIGKKTIGGSLAVLAATLATLTLAILHLATPHPASPHFSHPCNFNPLIHLTNHLTCCKVKHFNCHKVNHFACLLVTM